MRKRKRPLSAFGYKGFTLVELLLALVVAAIVSTAVLTLAFAMSSANDVMDSTSRTQAYVRYATFRISELIRHCKLICAMPGDDLAVWRADDNGDGQINPRELVYIEMGTGRDYVRLLEFPSAENWRVTLSSVLGGTAKHELMLICHERQTTLVPECSNAQIVLDSSPPWSKLVSMSFDLVENGVVRQYQINTALHGWSGHLLNDSGDVINSDDD
ncbi:MAG: prepilin-type N-terminal cleavage/methylation domain-containing protein [Phycisphaerae bacterium]|nr:prepilin-type N-terminal cleavage/methylation domain-containing protein [Phycisphaerae bacterium]NIP52075.1 prepilin-type N-terminal cleavage/methylation domain-containing protein [Phycisphaerae bacterium]NIS50040.1 prepilin-type N-terminal cleavage/methylation domain-containing protein [Phycisphaerae bacterium]NIU10295.1 prepilin-type N-terminal cleavage/methylation domain-containing protein [Phycisphaerae bacterium]NIU55306.1 prepilin-type N-terminal cleavage/methylation domain-containing 